MQSEPNKLGLSKKTNITIAAIAALATSAGQIYGLIAIGSITLVALTYQFILDLIQVKK